jgi:muconolactone delta-isomerase
MTSPTVSCQVLGEGFGLRPVDRSGEGAHLQLLIDLINANDVQPPTKGFTMSSTADPIKLQTFIVVATIRDDTDFAEMMALRADEQKRIAVLQSEGRIGVDHVAPSRATAFLEVFASDEEHVMETLTTLPFNPFFDVDIFPIAVPDNADARQS